MSKKKFYLFVIRNKELDEGIKSKCATVRPVRRYRIGIYNFVVGKNEIPFLCVQCTNTWEEKDFIFLNLIKDCAWIYQFFFCEMSYGTITFIGIGLNFFEVEYK